MQGGNPGADLARYAQSGGPQIALLMELNRNTVNRFLKAPRELNVQEFEEQSHMSVGIEVVDSILRSLTAPSETGEPGTFRMTFAFALFKRKRKAYTTKPGCSQLLQRQPTEPL